MNPFKKKNQKHDRQNYFTIKLSFMEIFQVFVTMFLKSSAADLLYVGKG